MPTLTVTCTDPLPSVTGSWAVRRTVSATFSAPERDAPSTTITNSSPPIRATVSLARRAPRSRAARTRSSSSPATWPNVSLTPLKSSMSANRTANRVPSRRAGENLGQAVDHQVAIREPGQGVMGGEVLERRLRLLELVDLARDPDQPDDLGPRHRAAGAWRCGSSSGCRRGAGGSRPGPRSAGRSPSRAGPRDGCARRIRARTGRRPTCGTGRPGWRSSRPDGRASHHKSGSGGWR